MEAIPACPGGRHRRQLLNAYFLAPVLILSFFSAGCGADKPDGHNVVLITIDTLRADRLGCYGYEAARTPHLDRLANEGVLFTRAFCQSPLTLPSHASILTGRYPPEHGARLNGTYNFRNELPTLATVLQDEGYSTGAFVSAQVLSSTFGLEAGFDVYDDTMQGATFDISERSGEETTSRALEWLQSQKDEPFFLWLHLFDPHFPYVPESNSGPGANAHVFSFNPSADYDSEIARADVAVGRMIEFLEAGGLLEDTLIIATSDHGESLGEHGERFHGLLVYDSTMRIPLIIRKPLGDQAPSGPPEHGRKLDALVESIDIFPTVLNELGIELPQDLPGIDLLAETLTPRSMAYGESLYAHAHRWSPLFTWRSDTWKYIKAPEPELYDTKIDPAETVNRVEAEGSQAETMDSALEAFLNRVEQPEAEGETSQNWENLESLGYLGGGIPDREDYADLSLPNPNTRIGIHNTIMDAMNFIRTKQYDLALGMLDPLKKTEDRNPQYRKTVGQAYLLQGRPDLAIEEFRSYYELSSQEAKAAHSLALALAMDKRYEEARNILTQTLEDQPKFTRGWQLLAMVHGWAGDIDRALEAGRRGIEIEPDNPESYVQLGMLCMEANRFEEAEELFGVAAQLDPDNRQTAAYLRQAQARKATGE